MATARKIKTRDVTLNAINKVFETAKNENEEKAIIQSTLEVITTKFEKICAIHEELENIIDVNDIEEFTEESTQIEIEIKTKIKTLEFLKTNTDGVQQHDTQENKNNNTRLPKL